MSDNIRVCLDCGVSEFTVPETELCVLVAGGAEQRKEVAPARSGANGTDLVDDRK
jgi:hypothetical protein